MFHQWRRYNEQQDLDHLRILAANEDDVDVGPFDDCDAVLIDEQFGRQYEIGIMAQERCERCGGIVLSDPPEDYIVFLGGDDWRTCGERRR
jgi:hypothetical protein